MKFRPQRMSRLLQASMIGALFSSPAFAGGFNLDHQNAAALGAAFAGAEATPAQAAFAAYNPAAIGRIERFDVAASASGIWPEAEYSNANGTLLGASPITGQSASDDVFDDAFVPNVSLAYSPIDRLTLGLVANGTFGFGSDIDANSVVRYQARNSEVRVIEIAPMVAYEVLPNVVLGAGLRAQYLDLSFTSVIDAGGIAFANGIPGFTPGSSDLPATFNGDDWALGYAVGLQASPIPLIDLGFTYTSAVEHEIRGNSHFDLDSSVAGQTLNGAVGLFDATNFKTKMDTPATAALGARFNVHEKARLLLSTRVMFWSDFDVVAISFDDGATPTETVTQNWRDTWILSVGGELDVLKGTTLRTGFMYDQSPVRGRLATPRIPDGDRYWISAGVTQAITEQISADFGLAYAFFAERRIHNDGTRPEDTFRGSLNARFRAQVLAASLGIRCKF